MGLGIVWTKFKHFDKLENRSFLRQCKYDDVRSGCVVYHILFWCWLFCGDLVLLACFHVSSNSAYILLTPLDSEMIIPVGDSAWMRTL